MQNEPTDRALVEAAEQPQQIAPFTTQGEREFVLAQRQAVALSKSSLVPDTYRDKPANVMIALELAQRLGCSALAVMQSLFIVKGKPSFSGQFQIALVNASPRFDGGLRFEVIGTDARKKDYRIRAWSVSKQTGERCNGAWIDWPMVEGEGWLAQNQKWKNMPEIMFHYRAGSFFTRVYAPEISLGLLSREELEDLHGQIGAIDGKVQRNEDLKALLLGAPAAAATPAAPDRTADQADRMPRADGIGITFAEVEGNLLAAQTPQALDEAADLIRSVAEKEERAKLQDLYEIRFAKLEAAAGDLLGPKP